MVVIVLYFQIFAVTGFTKMSFSCNKNELFKKAIQENYSGKFKSKYWEITRVSASAENTAKDRGIGLLRRFGVTQQDDC